MVKRKLSLIPAQIQKFDRIIERFPKARVMVVGDFILDEFIWGTVSRISPEAPVPVVKVNRESFMPGGALNVAHNVSTLGGQVLPVGVLGKDLPGRMLVRAMRQQGIETGGVIYDPTRPTTLKTRIIAHHQQVVRFDKEHTAPISVQDRRAILNFIRKKIYDVEVVIIEDYGKGLISADLLQEVIALAKRARKKILVDPKEKHFAYYDGVTSMTPNRYEAYSMLGLESGTAEMTVEEVGRKIMDQLHLECLLITLGEEGMVLFEKNGKIVKIPTVAREVFDVSGAGDTVIATFALALAAGADFPEAAMLSNLAAGIVVGKLGTATASPQELSQALKGGI
jgi:D-beta-D-heptose 7-phosphate kinase/D-beta-D-heptose 1-phosphate adenosyltransferase